MLIKPQVYLWMCPDCGVHGRIKFSSGKQTDVLTSEKQAVSVLILLKRENAIDEKEYYFLRSEIERKFSPEELLENIRQGTKNNIHPLLLEDITFPRFDEDEQGRFPKESGRPNKKVFLN